MTMPPPETALLTREAPRAAAVPACALGLRDGAAIIIALMLPLLMTSFITFQLTLVMIYGLAILGLNLLTGFSGQFSLGHSAFYGIGAYTAAILMDQVDFAYYSTLPCAGVLCFVVGFLFGLPALRLQGLYLALATFALATAMPQILKFHLLEPLTGGVQGISILKPDPPPGVPLSADQWLYYFTGGAAGNVCRCGKSRQAPHRTSDHGDPRPPARGRSDGHQYGALQDPDVWRQRALHRCR